MLQCSSRANFVYVKLLYMLSYCELLNVYKTGDT